MAEGGLPVTNTNDAVLAADPNTDGLPGLVLGNDGQENILINVDGNLTDESRSKPGSP